MKHVNVYGPKASGKTRNAETLRKKYGCVDVWDEGHNFGTPPVAHSKRRTLVLTIEPIINEHFTNIPIEEALR